MYKVLSQRNQKIQEFIFDFATFHLKLSTYYEMKSEYFPVTYRFLPLENFEIWQDVRACSKIKEKF